ncbi:MAG: type II CAAX endopeptidase family protein [Candidatus Acidiferrales bacterium]
MSTSILETASEPRPRRPLVAPLWHTIVFVVFVCGYAFFGRATVATLESRHITTRVPLYLFMIGFELVLVAYVWFLGVKPAGGTMLGLIGGKWSSARDVLRDIGVAFMFWMVVIAVLVGLRFSLGVNTQAVRAAMVLAPRSLAEISLWVVLALSAGICEEFVFRGYLQKQFLALTGSDVAAVVLQALVFGAAHSYQGVRGMITIGVYGALFGVLAVNRKSLRPGMIQHFMQDSFAGLAVVVLQRLGKLPAALF